MLAMYVSRRADIAQGRGRLIWIISIVVGATVVATATLVVFHLIRHRRRREQNHFRQAWLRDPSLTWEEYARKGRLTRSRLWFEDEVQRSNMIRKSQQSRTSDHKDSGAVSVEQELPQLQTSPSRSKSWHGRSRNTFLIGCGNVESGRGHGDSDTLPREVLADWSSVHASVERTWQLLHGKKFPTLASRSDGQLWNNDDEDVPSRPPTVRLKTPPLLSHPIFRDGNEQHRPKHMSLPTELTRAKH